MTVEVPGNVTTKVFSQRAVWGSSVGERWQDHGEVDAPSVSVLLILVSIVTAVEIIVDVGSVYMLAPSVTGMEFVVC